MCKDEYHLRSLEGSLLPDLLLDSSFLAWQDSYDTALEKVDAFHHSFGWFELFPISRREIVPRFKPFDWMSYADRGWFQESIVAMTQVI
jgi:hypothetical protein